MNIDINKIKAAKLILLLIILIYAFVIRVNYLGESPLWIDETISASVAKQIVETGVPCFESGYCYWRAYMFHYGMAFFIKIFGGDFGAKFISVIFGVLTVLLGYFYGRDIAKSRFVSLAFPLLLAISTWQINYSKQARMYQAFCFFYFLSIYLFFKIFVLKDNITRNKYADYFLLLISIILTIHIQEFGYILIPILIILYLINNWNKLTIQHKFISLAISLIFGVFLANKYMKETKLKLSITYFEWYLQSYFSILIVVSILLISIVTLLLKNKKMGISYILLLIVPLVALSFLKEFASRYYYFNSFLIIFLFARLLTEVKLKFLITIILIIALNGTFFSIYGIQENNYDYSMPDADYKKAYLFLNNLSNETLKITSWSPAAIWYEAEFNYQIDYSISGYSNSNFFKSNFNSSLDKFSNKPLIANEFEIEKPYYIVIEAQSNSKIDINNFNLTNCKIEFQSKNIEIKSCN